MHRYYFLATLALWTWVMHGLGHWTPGFPEQQSNSLIIIKPLLLQMTHILSGASTSVQQLLISSTLH